MGRCVEIGKIWEDDNCCHYRFADPNLEDVPEAQSGLLELDKISGETRPLNDLQNNHYYAARFKLRQHWAAGEFPDRTWFH